MSGITYIKRIDGATNNLVYLETTDTTATATGSGYITAQTPNITLINDGAWTWEVNDCIMLSASDGISWCKIDSSFTTLTAFSGAGAGDVTYTAPSIANHIATYTNTTGNISKDAATAINGGNIQAGLSGTAGTLASFPATAANGSFIFKAINNAGNFSSTLSNSNIGQATVYSLPDAGVATTNVLLADNAGTQHITTGSLSVDVGNLLAGSSGHAGTVSSFPAAASKGSLALVGVANTGNTITTISNAAMGQASVVSIPDPGAATANFLLDTGTGASISVNNLKYGATPVAQVDPGSCTISAAAGAANHCTITIQLKDGSGTNMSCVTPFKVYLATSNLD